MKYLMPLKMKLRGKTTVLAGPSGVGKSTLLNALSKVMNEKSEATTGQIDVANVSAGQMKLSVSTGDIKASSVTCEGTVDTHVTTGDIKLEDVVCKDLQSTGTTGDLIMKNDTASGEFRLERSTGDIRLENCDAGNITAKTSTGDVVGTLRTDKIFITDTGTGDVDVPKTTSGGVCDITTGTGDIRIKIGE